ncbi:MAG TPA: ATP synthase F1 subunit epsilon [Thermoanaerobaculia bacterium]|nr:ATP synthase F1 subunit epsilon [Thermoanaerobaculia bacterium]
MKLKLQVVTPTRTVVATEADSVELPGELGYLGILPGHTPLITVLKTGVLTYRAGADERSVAISAGFAEIANDMVTVLADQAEEPGEVDVSAAERERSKAEEELKTAGRESLDEVRSRLALAEARLAIAKKGR